MSKTNIKNSHRGYFILLIGLFVTIIMFSLFAVIFHFEDYLVYRELVFGGICLDIVLLLFIVIAEALSLKFDKSALRITLYATIFLYISYLFSGDSMFAWAFIGVNIEGLVEQMFMILSNLFSILFLISIFHFFQIAYGGKRFHILHMCVWIPLWMLYSVFTLLDLPIPSLITLTIEVLYFLVFTAIYYLVIKQKEYDLAGHISMLLAIFISFALIFNQLEAMGVGTFIYFCIFLGYIFIYVSFLVEKTKKTYQYEEIERLKLKENKINVTCFHCFDCVYNGVHLDFPSKKSKEYFAMLVILRGKALTIDKAISYLYPDKSIEKAKRAYRKIVSETRDYLILLGFEAVTFNRGEASLNTSLIHCDYYDVIDGKSEYKGEPLMPEYNWSFEFESQLH